MELASLAKLWGYVADHWPFALVIGAYFIWDLIKFFTLRTDKRKELEAEQALKLRDQLMQVNEQAQGQVKRTLEIISDLTEQLNAAIRAGDDLRRLHARLFECIDYCVIRFPETAPIFENVMLEIEQWRRERKASRGRQQ